MAPRPPKLFDPTDERRRRKVELERKSLFSSPDDSTKLHSGPAVVAELERALAESGDQHVFQRHAYVSALATIDSLDATLAMPYLIRMLAARQLFTEPTRLPHDSLDGRLERSSHVVAFELLLDLAATQAGRRALTRHVLEIAAVAPAAPPPRQSSVGTGVPWADDEPVSWWRTRTAAAGGSWSSSSGASRRSDELSAVRLVASIDVALMVDGDDVRAENERLRAAADDARADAEDARGRRSTSRLRLEGFLRRLPRAAAKKIWRPRSARARPRSEEWPPSCGRATTRPRRCGGSATSSRGAARATTAPSICATTTTRRRRSGSATRCASSSTTSSGSSFGGQEGERRGLGGRRGGGGDARISSPDDGLFTGEDRRDCIVRRGRARSRSRPRRRRPRATATRPAASRAARDAETSLKVHSIKAGRTGRGGGFCKFQEDMRAR